jgi:hypothetical protein
LRLVQKPGEPDRSTGFVCDSFAFLPEWAVSDHETFNSSAAAHRAIDRANEVHGPLLIDEFPREKKHDAIFT